MVNPQLLYKKYEGDSLSYDGIKDNTGQCVQWAEYVLTDSQYGYGLQPFYGNAVDWWNKFGGVLSKNFDKVSDGSVKKGDFVIFNQLVGSVYGHIDMAMTDGAYTQFTGADSNWGGNKTVHLVNHVGAQYIIGTLRLKGVGMTDVSQLADLRLGWLNQLGALYNVPGPIDGNSINQIIANIATERANNQNVVNIAEDRLKQIQALQQSGTGNFVPYNGAQLYTKKG